LRDFLFPKAQHAPGFIRVAVNETSNPLVPTKGHGLRVLSPEETLHAMILAIKRDMDANLPVDDWLTITLSSPVQFEAVEESDMFLSHDDSGERGGPVRSRVLLQHAVSNFVARSSGLRVRVW